MLKVLPRRRQRPSRRLEVRTQSSVGGLRTSTPPPIADVELIDVVPTTSAQGLAVDQAQIEQSLQDSETTVEVVPGSTLTAQGLKRG
jgi:hypothetical protein